MVVGGWGADAGKSVEMIDLEDPENSCTFQEDFPIKVDEGMGQLTPNGLFYCGGYSSGRASKKCFKFKGTKFVDAEFSLKKPRYGASSVLYEDSFVVLFGRDGDYFRDLEVVPANQRMQFPKFRLKSKRIESSVGCAVVYKKNIIITGGSNQNYVSNKMQIINSSTVEEKYLKHARRFHGCTIFRFQQKDILVVAGNDLNNEIRAKSTEFVILNNNMEYQEGRSSCLKIDRSQ